jgi:integrase/recombinase XerD
MTATISIILDTRRMKQSNKYPVKLRVTFQRVPEYYQTIFDLSKDEWEKLGASRISNELQIVRNKLKEIEKGATSSIDNIEPFSFEEFEKSFIKIHPHFRQRKQKEKRVPENSVEFDYTPFQKKFPILLEAVGKPGTLSFSYIVYIKKLLREGRIGTAVSYQCSYISLKKFKGDVPFSFITTSFLIEYENWLKDQDVSKSTIGIYLRPLRAIFNEADADGIIKKARCYPFGKRKYVIPTSRNIKKALELSDIEKIFFYQCESNNSSEQQAKDYWLFSYFGNGMNPKDIANLKYKNISGDYIHFERSKTERSLRNDPKPITVFLIDDMKNIIAKWGNTDKSPNNYIFPILENGLSPLRQYELIKSFVRFINDWMKQILENVGINKKVTTYVARHTFSTVLKRSGASTEFIQEALGHSDLKTTENYLDSFEKETKREFAHHLSAFKKIKQPENAFVQ